MPEHDCALLDSEGAGGKHEVLLALDEELGAYEPRQSHPA
jgi:hypothetical protein